MSSELTTYSDDDAPLGVNSLPNGHLNGHVSYTNGNGKHVPQTSEDSDMSEDDVPLLVRSTCIQCTLAVPRLNFILTRFLLVTIISRQS